MGRDEVIHQCLKSLQDGKTVWISGAGGTGKTALGAAVAAQWPTQTVFWLTIRAGLNDQLRSVLFSLGYFLHQHGASVLWRQLVADNGQIKDFNLALGLARHDLESLHTAEGRGPLLLCLDDVDCLLPPAAEIQTETQRQVLKFLEGLQKYAAMLLMGQRVVLPVDTHVSLENLTLSQVAQLLDNAGIVCTSKEIERLTQYTGGNPRLLMLCVTLCQHVGNLGGVLTSLPKEPMLLPLFYRVWQQLTPQDRALLRALCVFQTAVPRYLWQDDDGRLAELVSQSLIQEDGHGGIGILPTWREIIYEQLHAEEREYLHLQAAAVRSAYGSYTSAAYHYWCGGDASQAISAWYEHREEEIRHGQASQALAIFCQISTRGLNRKMIQKLALIRGELYQLVGEAEAAIWDFQSVEWSPEEEDTIAATLLWGDFLESTGQSERAMDKYQEGIDVAARLLAKLVRLRVKRSTSALRHKDMSMAWHEGQLASYEAENLQGILQDQRGNFAEAQRHYSLALSRAEDLRYEEGIAHTNVNLAVLAGRKGDTETAQSHLEKAVAHYEHIGDTLRREMARINLAATYIQAQQYVQAIAPAQQAFDYFCSISHPYFTAVTASNLAEAYYGSGNWDEAVRYARQVLQLEDVQSYPYALYTLGNVMQAQKEYEQAEQYYEQAAQIAEQNEDEYMSAYAWRGLGQVYKKQKKRQKGETALTRALDLFRRLQLDKEADEVACEMEV